MGAAASAATIKHKTPIAKLSAFALRHCDLHLASGGEREDWEADERKKRKRAAAALEEEPRDFFHGIVPQQARASGYVALEDEAETDGARASRAAAERAGGLEDPARPGGLEDPARPGGPPPPLPALRASRLRRRAARTSKESLDAEKHSRRRSR